MYCEDTTAVDGTAVRVAFLRTLRVESIRRGTAFLSFLTPREMLALARDAGFRAARHVSAAHLGERYFAERTYELQPPNNGEELLGRDELNSDVFNDPKMGVSERDGAENGQPINCPRKAYRPA